MRISELIAAIEQADERTFTIIRLAVEDRARSLGAAVPATMTQSLALRLGKSDVAVETAKDSVARLLESAYTRTAGSPKSGRPFQLTPEQVAEMVANVQRGHTVVGEAKRLGVSEMTASRYLKRARELLRQEERRRLHPSNR